MGEPGVKPGADSRPDSGSESGSESGSTPGSEKRRGRGGRVWYEDGLRFACTMCGNCCTGPEGVVWFTPEEGKAMAADLGVDEPTFYAQYARRVDGRWSLRERVVTIDGRDLHDCILLDRDAIPGKAVCGVYRARPNQCRTWPFWPENLTSRRAWDAAKKRAPCPGMDTGKLVRVEEIRVLREASEE